MKILLLGNGGREHALAWKIDQSQICSKLFIAPGNAGTALVGENVNIIPTDFEAIKTFVLAFEIEFVIVGPEDPLAAGICDFFRQDTVLRNVSILAPSQMGAMLESSKDFAKEFMLRHDVPTAAYKTFTQQNKTEAIAYLQNHSLPIVMKADGLAAGKGVVICESATEAIDFLNEVWEKNKFGKSGDKVVVEQFLTGIELSVFALTDGENYVLLPNAKDYKRIGDGDIGANTGGMGTVSPVPFADKNFMLKVEETIIKPTINGLKKEKIDFRGFVFFGLINVDGNPFVIEYNTRMGDPETQVVMPKIKSDLLPLLLDAANGKLNPEAKLEINDYFAVAVIAVSGGYPEDYEKGKKISGLEEIKGSLVFHAGTTKVGDDILTSGGRVLAMVSKGLTLEEARNTSYQNLQKISFEGMNYRKDIGLDLMQ
ncbi:MAG: phosphoribosylamine--glycine ligase [Bacteroidetes bacterium]|nr:phosphoribosylamine--glycine ligase [Bacteroidota bacterium]